MKYVQDFEKYLTRLELGHLDKLNDLLDELNFLDIFNRVPRIEPLIEYFTYI